MKVGPDFLTQPVFRMYWWALYIGLFGLVVLFRFVKPILKTLKFQLRVDKVVQETHDTWSIYIRGNGLEQLRYRNGQFAIWWFLDKQRFWQGHPFSISSQPGSHNLRLTFKASGDYTATLDKLKPGTWLIMDGPYGRFTDSASPKPKVLLIAGGIGVTPLFAMLQPMIAQGRDIILLYSAKTTADLALATEIKQLAAQGKVKVGYIITNDPNYRGITGMLDQAKLAKLVPDVRDRAAFVCGPPPMMAAISTSLRNLGVPKDSIFTENFSF